MNTLKNWYRGHQKAVGGAIAGGGAALVNALLDGHIDGGECLTIAGAVLGAFGLVFAFPKNKDSEPEI